MEALAAGVALVAEPLHVDPELRVGAVVVGRERAARVERKSGLAEAEGRLLRVVELLAFELVAVAPDDYARVITVALDHLAHFELVLSPVCVRRKDIAETG